MTETTSGTAPPRAGRREWLGLVALAMPTMLIGLDGTVLHLAIPHLAADLGPSSTEVLWITDIYGFLVASLLVTMGSLGDRIGRRRLLLIGAAAFGTASVIAAYAPSTELLIAARALLGVAGATLMPSTLSLIRNMFHDAGQRRLAVSIWMTNFAAGGALGPVVGGLLLERFWWGSAFLLAVPVMVVLLVLGRVLLPEYRDPRPGRIDLPSVALSLGALLPLVYGVKELAKHGLATGFVPPLALVVGALVGAVFIRRQRRLDQPLLDLSLFRRLPFTAALATQGFGLFVQAGVQFLILQYLQLVLGLSPLTVGLWAVPAMVAGVAGTMLAPALVRIASPARVITVSLLSTAASLAVLTQVGTETGLAAAVVGFALASLAVSPAVALSTDLIIASAPPERAGSASGIGETSNELGIALGIALLGSVTTAVYRGHVAGGVTALENADRLGADQAAVAGDTLPGALGVAEGMPGGSGLVELARTGFAQGVQTSAVVGMAVMVVLAIVAGRLLRGVRAETGGEEPENAAADDEAAPEEGTPEEGTSEDRDQLSPTC